MSLALTNEEKTHLFVLQAEVFLFFFYNVYNLYSSPPVHLTLNSMFKR